ncbi:MAG: PAS domain S-box protein, partial [Candidatus Marinimicrobia bacterium]|nr:PAS domain S-box protein [Candidatus Neomarinimicrobiota bacterium]
MTNLLSNSFEDLQSVQQAILDDLSEMVTITDIEGSILYVNEAVLDVMKMSRDSIVGKSVFEIYGDADFFGSSQEEILEQSLTAGGFQGELMIHDSGGDFIPCRLRTSVFTDDNKIPQYIIGISTILTGERSAEEALQKTELKYQKYVKNAPLGVFIVDKDGNYLEVNQVASEITGYSEEELYNMNVRDFQLTEGDENHTFQTLLDESAATDVKKFRRKDGSVGWWSINSVKLSDDRYLGLTIDVTGMKKLEQELSDSESNLNRAQKVARIGSWSIDLESRT